MTEYAAFLRSHRGLSPRTVDKRVWQVTRFAAYLEQDGVTRFAAITPRHIHDFLIGLLTQAVATRQTDVTTLHGFFRGPRWRGCFPATSVRPCRRPVNSSSVASAVPSPSTR